MKEFVILLMFLFSGIAVSAQTSITGTWEGFIDIQEQELGIIANIEGEQGNYSGTLDIPMQGARGIPFMYVVVNGDSLSMAFNAGPNIGEFSGHIISENLIEGTYSQGGASFPFEIRKRDSAVVAEEVGVGQELIIQSGDIKIAGTLVTPEQTEQSPVVILLSGSGAQDRDSEIVGFKLFAQIAEHLKSKNIASFRYDDRQVGKSTGSFSNASLEMLASDVNAVIQFLQDSVNTDFGDVILLGHSQGGIVAGKVASENSQIDQLILMASPGVNMQDILRFQVRQAYEGFNLPEEAIEQEISARENLMETIRDGEGINAAKQEYIEEYRTILKSLSEEQQAAIPEDTKSFIDRQVNQLVKFYSSPQMQSLLFHDPIENLEELEIPVLVLFGGKDTQVPAGLNREPVEDALEDSGAEFKIFTFEDANHLFQEAKTGEVTEYATLGKSFIEGFLSTISDWIQSH